LLFISVPEIPPEALGVKYISERLVEELRDSDLCPIPSDSEGPLIELLTVMCSDKVDGCQLSSLCVPKDSIPLVTSLSYSTILKPKPKLKIHYTVIYYTITMMMLCYCIIS